MGGETGAREEEEKAHRPLKSDLRFEIFTLENLFLPNIGLSKVRMT